MRYQVPQFIEVEDKIFGPLTLKQFMYLAGGAGLCLIFFSLLPLYITFLLSLPVLALAGGLAFYQINGRPLVVALEHGFSYFLGHKLYLWKQRPVGDTKEGIAPKAAPITPPVPKLSESKLKDIAWSLNIKDRARMGVADTAERTGFEI